MFSIRLDASICTSCGICVDVCSRGALDLRRFRRIGVAGIARVCNEAPTPSGTFPFLRAPEACDGCLDCVRECPVAALALLRRRSG